MKKCGIIITKPGAVTVTEAFKAGREIYLIPGLPIIEENNRIYEIKYFLAKDFSIEQFNCSDNKNNEA
ncbi:MAG: hypothetical protein HYR97_05240 [Candidatus Melainabacteria bacterium]|nr:hypothetical protein [Candidatus Melainabacteria bacterium]